LRKYIIVRNNLESQLNLLANVTPLVTAKTTGGQNSRRSARGEIDGYGGKFSEKKNKLRWRF